MDGFCPSYLMMSAPVLSFSLPEKLGLQRLMTVFSTKLMPAALSPVLQCILQTKTPASPHPSPDCSDKPFTAFFTEQLAHLLEPASGCLLGQQPCFPKAGDASHPALLWTPRQAIIIAYSVQNRHDCILHAPEQKEQRLSGKEGRRSL